MREQWKEFRRFRRKSVILACVLETSRGNVQSVALDLSLGGARVRVQGRVEPQEQVTLVLAKFGRFPGEIVWRNASEAGLQFKDSPEEVLLRFGNDIPFD
ncbi:MAG TPA: PilZ domain-containing protein [Stellaceae bacterium]|nr:PilZ domain-containing protein [Stellaceae bacterium]